MSGSWVYGMVVVIASQVFALAVRLFRRSRRPKE